MKASRQLWRVSVVILGSFAITLVVLAGFAYLTNQNIPEVPETTTQLTALDKVRLAESIHLRQTLGNKVWVGFGDTDIPIALWNEETIFLVDYPGFPPGWELVPQDRFQGEGYYRQSRGNAENFTFPLNGVWVASVATKYEADRFVRETFHNVLPDFLEVFFPYRLILTESETQMTAVLKESFYAYLASEAPAAFAEAQRFSGGEEAYWRTAGNANGNDAWCDEVKILIKALKTPDDEEARRLARTYLEARDERRAGGGFDSSMVAYETRLEWMNGLASYASTEIWRMAANDPSYQPLPQMEDDPYFKHYQTFAKVWQRMLNQAVSSSGCQSKVRFTYSGMLQAMVLKRLMPSWQERALQPQTSLEDLLRIASAED